MVRVVTGAAVMVAGAVVWCWSMSRFLDAGTSIIPRRVPNALVGDGPYRFSRNPIYLAKLLFLAGWGLVLGAPLACLLVLPMFWMLREWFVKGEEKVLAERFGGAYSDYCARVRRWI